MTKHHSPPPTKFGPGSVSQAKTAITPVRGLHVPPQTRFGAPAPAQAKMVQPKTAQARTAIRGAVVQRMEQHGIQNPDGELSVYEGFILTKKGGGGVAEFQKAIEDSPLFHKVLEATRGKLKLITGFHGGMENPRKSMSGGWFEQWFDPKENQSIEQSRLARFVDMRIVRPVEGQAWTVASPDDLIKDSVDGGGVFYAWCFSDAAVQRVKPGLKLMTF